MQVITTNTGEESHIKWNFDQWVTNNELQNVKQVFIDHRMNTFSSLSVNNKNFAGLLYDQRMLSNPQIVPKIMSAIHSLEISRIEQQNDKKKKEKTKLVFVSNEENETLTKIKQYLLSMQDVLKEVQNIDTLYDKKKLLNKQKIKTYQKHCNENLDKMTQEIGQTFNNLHNILNKTEKRLADEIVTHKNNVDKISTLHEIKMQKLDESIKDTQLMITDDEKYYKEQIITCKEAIRDHADTQNEYDFSSKNETRKQKIVAIGAETRKYYSERRNIINVNKQQINKYIQHELKFNDKNDNEDETKTEVYYVSTDKAVYNDIIADIDTLITVYSMDDNKSQNSRIRNERSKMKQLQDANNSLRNEHLILKQQYQQKYTSLNDEINSLKNKIQTHKTKFEKERNDYITQLKHIDTQNQKLKEEDSKNKETINELNQPRKVLFGWRWNSTDKSSNNTSHQIKRPKSASTTTVPSQYAIEIYRKYNKLKIEYTQLMKEHEKLKNVNMDHS